MRFENISTQDEFETIDKLRYSIDNIEYAENNYFINKIKNKDIYVLACFNKEEIVAGMYISNYLDSLYIEKIFVKHEYRGFNIASNMINYVIDNKEYFEACFKKEINFSKLEPNSMDLVKVYKKLGYRGPDKLNIMKKRI